MIAVLLVPPLIPKRWLYRHGRLNRLARLLNRGWAIAHTAGLWPSRWVTLEVRGRRTGRVISLPLAVADYRGERYLVAMLGEGSSWVRNVRAAGGRVVLPAYTGRSPCPRGGFRPDRTAVSCVSRGDRSGNPRTWERVGPAGRRGDLQRLLVDAKRRVQAAPGALDQPRR